MNQNDKELLGNRLPAILTVEQTAVLLGLQPYTIPILIRAKLLKPLAGAKIGQSAPRRLAAVTIEQASRDLKWLDKAIQVLTEENKAKRKAVSKDKRLASHGSANDPRETDPGTDESSR